METDKIVSTKLNNKYSFSYHIPFAGYQKNLQSLKGRNPNCEAN